MLLGWLYPPHKSRGQQINNLLTIKQSDIDPKAADSDISGYRKRDAARAVLQDDDDRVYLMNVRIHGYHKLPGGGIKKGEGITQALQRELLEEVGCSSDILEELGTVIEHQQSENGGLNQTSFCYLARQIGEQVKSALEAGEIAEGMIQMKARNIDDAITILENDNPDNMEGRFIQRRDLTFLKTAKIITSLH